jgi:hypothetical protein
MRIHVFLNGKVTAMHARRWLTNPLLSGREDMTKERSQASFNIREMTYYLDGGEAATKVKRKKRLRDGLCLTFYLR